ncbi:MAG: helix-turn-helix transcriptional regulator [Polyangiales bacterium]|nr:helix-turn-helix transcriptional regulator [Myxococcales bacterium]MCB9656829.1 helix-turn-helix transcriptional regulator [Sandaracinaceae bacterium]
MRIDNHLSDESVTAELGERLAALRVARSLTQEQLSVAAGISKRTVERLEGGGSTQLVNLIRCLRALDTLSAMDALVPPATSDPIDLLQRRGKRRQRVRARAEAPAPTPAAWVWGDDK